MEASSLVHSILQPYVFHLMVIYNIHHILCCSEFNMEYHGLETFACFRSIPQETFWKFWDIFLESTHCEELSSQLRLGNRRFLKLLSKYLQQLFCGTHMYSWFHHLRVLLKLYNLIPRLFQIKGELIMTLMILILMS